MATTAIQAVQQAPQQALTLGEQMQYAQMLCKSTLVPRDYQRKPENILIAMGFGQSMGLSPVESLYRITVIQGRPTASAELTSANVRRAGHKLRLAQDDAAQRVTCTIIRADDPDAPFTATWDMAKAQQAQLTGKDNWRKYPMAMLTARAITECARHACPEALFGCIYTAEEMGSATDSGGVTVEVLDAQPAPAPAPAPAPQPEQPVAEQPVAEQPVAEQPGLKAAQKQLGNAMRRAKDVGFSMAEVKQNALDMYGAPMEQLEVKQLVEFTEAVNELVNGFIQGQAC